MPITPEMADQLSALKPRDMVLIDWVDAHAHDITGWTPSSLIRETTIKCVVRTVGWFVTTRDDFVVVAGDYIVDGVDDDDTINSVSCVPNVCITRLEVIQHG